MKQSHVGSPLGAVVGFAVFLFASFPVLAQVAPDLGTAASYAVLGTNSIPTSGTVTCTTSTINGDIGSTFNSITNTGCTTNGAIVAPVPNTVVTDFNNAKTAIDSQNAVCGATIPTATTTLPPGVYCSAAGTTLGAGVILTLNGGPTDVWVFRIGTSGSGALTATSAQVVMGGTAQACNVYWRTADGATMTDATFLGTILSGAAATVTRGNFLGRVLATTDVTLTDVQPLTFAGCAAAATDGIPALDYAGLAILMVLLAIAGLFVVNRM